MTWKRRLGIITAITLAQLGILVGYHALLTGSLSAASAGQARAPNTEPSIPPVSVAENQSSNTATMPPIPLPAMGTAEPPLAAAMILPVAAQEVAQLPQPKEPAPLLQQPPPGLPGRTVGYSVPLATKGSDSPAPFPWSVALEIIDGRTHLKLHNGKDMKLTVSCDKLDVQTPRGRIEASGKVKFTSDNIEGTCERLTISWQEEDVVVLEKVQLKCKLEGQAAEVAALQLRLRLNRIVGATTASNAWWDWAASKQ
jgi:hypothetical protein